jgi:hypothetical protein
MLRGGRGVFEPKSLQPLTQLASDFYFRKTLNLDWWFFKCQVGGLVNRLRN